MALEEIIWKNAEISQTTTFYGKCDHGHRLESIHKPIIYIINKLQDINNYSNKNW